MLFTPIDYNGTSLSPFLTIKIIKHKSQNNIAVACGQNMQVMHDQRTFLNTKKLYRYILYSLHIIHKYIFIVVLGGGVEVTRKYLGKTKIFRGAI